MTHMVILMITTDYWGNHVCLWVSTCSSFTKSSLGRFFVHLFSISFTRHVHRTDFQNQPSRDWTETNSAPSLFTWQHPPPVSVWLCGSFPDAPAGAGRSGQTADCDKPTVTKWSWITCSIRESRFRLFTQDVERKPNVSLRRMTPAKPNTSARFHGLH